MHYVYLLLCSDGTYYTGYTKDVSNRVGQHNKGVGARYTRGRRPVCLVGFKGFPTQKEAMREELRVKAFSKESKARYFA